MVRKQKQKRLRLTKMLKNYEKYLTDLKTNIWLYLKFW